ncbi:hypothetical protein [Polyangium mundeleinium]|uniref:ATP-grasp domain-containing protein n=1 Tax=Polyangium mundeleinium TaxID=2995306 RepID=A0ABT5F741_9BACT|nr:hypothetical protein [Polyangium mundeleinium]MDC0748901.1 hypothetical protein [Polyangium mundeleinium]
MGARIAWLLNLGAEVELEDARRTLGAEARARLPELVGRLGALVRPTDILLWGGSDEARRAEGAVGKAWLPTPRALAALAQAGARVPAAPSYEVLRRVNDRRFSLGLGATLPGQRAVTTLDEVREALAAPSPGGNWLLRRPHGFAGRGRRRAREDEVHGAARSWIEASLRSFGALVVEPWVERVADFGWHGFVSREGRLSFGEPTWQETAPDGTWLSTRPAKPGEIGREETEAFAQGMEQAGAALVAAGYFGPFGLDAFRWRDEKGSLRFNPRCEINARYSMGWGIGMGERRPDLDPEE